MLTIVAVAAIVAVVAMRVGSNATSWRGVRAQPRGFEGARPNANPAAGAGQRERLERLEHAIDAIAIEVERIGEGQRFLVKLLVDEPKRQPESVRP